MAASDHAAPISRREDALAVVERLVRAGHIAYFAGGCVRDMLLNLPSKDFDVATNAAPEVVRSLFARSQGVGQAFGVILVRFGTSQIEVATFRTDGAYTDGRRPDDVRFATAEEDAQRRDFTINGLFYDPIADKVIDLVGGQADLAAKTLRAIGDPAKRFAEDYLRLLRAVRFAARFDLNIEPTTAAAIRTNADRLPRIAPERIADELRAMLTPPTRTHARRLLDGLDLTPVLLRQLTHDKAPLTAGPSGDPSLFSALEPGKTISFPLALAAYVLDTLMAQGQPSIDGKWVSYIAREMRQRLRLSNDEYADLSTIGTLVDLLPPKPMPSIASLKRFLARPFAADAMQLLSAMTAVGHEADRARRIMQIASTFPADQIAPPPLVNGIDLQQLGYAPGPRFKTTLDAVYDAQLESRITTRDDGLALAKSILVAAS